MADETFIDLGVQGDSKELEKFSSSLENVIKSLDNLTQKLNKAVSTINKYTGAIVKEIEAQSQLMGIQDENTSTTNKNTETTKDNTEATEDNTHAQEDNNTVIDEGTESTHENTEATEKNNKAREQQNKELQKAIKGFLGFVGAITGAVYALNRFTTDLAKNNQAMLNLTRQSDIALSAFQKWDGLGKLFGIENAEQQLASLNEKIFELKLTGEGARGFQLAGIMPTNAEDVLEQLRNRVSGMSDTSATYLLKQMGIDPQMLTLLRMSREEFEELGQTIKKYQLTEEQRAEIQKLNGQMQLVNIQFQYFKDRAILALMPHLVNFMQSLARITEMFANLIENIKNNTAMRTFTVGLGYVLINIRKLAKHFLLLSRNATKFNSVFLAIGKTCAGVARFFKQFSGVITTLIAKIPILGRVFVGLGGIFKKALLPLYSAYLLLDDLAVFFQGGDSLIGRVIDWGKEKGGQISEAFGKMFGGDFLGGAGDLINTIVDILNDLLGTVKTILERLLSFLTFGLSDKFFNSKVGKFITGQDQIDKLKGLSNEKISYMATSPATENLINNYNSNSTNNTTNSPTIIQNNNIATNQPAQDIAQSLRYANSMITA